MSKRRLSSTAKHPTEKRVRSVVEAIEEEEEEAERSVERSVEKDVTELSIKELREELITVGTEPGPILPSTRNLYERLLIKKRAEKKTEKKKDTKKEKTPVKAEEEVISPTKSPVKVRHFDIESLPDPPVLTNKALSLKLKQLGQKPGPINDKNRKLYLELLDKKQGRGSETVLSTPAYQGRGGSERVLSTPASQGRGGAGRLSFAPASPLFNSTRIADPQEDMEIDNSRVTKRHRTSICKAKFENTDFVVFSPTKEYITRTDYYTTLKSQGVQALIVQDYDNLSLVNLVKCCEGDFMIYAGVTIDSLTKASQDVDVAAQSGCEAVVLSLGTAECSDPSSIAQCVKQVMQNKLTVSFFYHHNSSTKASPVQISQLLLQNVQGYQGILLSATSHDLLELELQGVKVYETDPDNILRSLSHGVDASATLLGNIIMPLIIELKGAFYEGNTSDCCKWQANICRLNALMTKYGDYLPSLHSLYKYARRIPGTLPPPYTALTKETLLFKDVADLAVFSTF